MPCDAPRTTDDIAADVVLAVAAFGRADLDAFTQATGDLDAALPCVNEEIDASLAAAVHRVEGIRAFVDKDDAKVTAAFGAARSVEPDWQFPSSLVRPGHPLRTRYDASLQTDLTAETVPFVAGGYLRIDGATTWDHHATLAALVQRFDAAGLVVETRYVWPGEPWLTYEVGRPATMRNEWSPTRRRLFAASAGTALLGAGLYGVAYAMSDAYRSADPSDPTSRVTYENGDAWRARTNGLVVVSAVAGATAVGLGAATVVTP